MNKHVEIPHWLHEGVKPLKNSYPKRPNLLVFDTETESRETGEPYLLIFYDGVKPSYLRVNKESILKCFTEYLRSHCPNRHSNIIFAHNLEFDIGAVLCDKWEEVFRWRKPLLIEVYDNNDSIFAEIQLYPQKTWFAQIRLNNGANVKVVDTASYIKGSLYNLSRELNLPFKKETKPEWLGRQPETKYEWKELVRYCRAEIKAQYELAKYVPGIHKKYDIGYTVSIAQLGSKIFRKYFLNSKIPQTAYPVRPLAEYCIHGGRAECFEKHPVVIPDVKMYDYNSFYPWAMTRLPPLTEGEWVQTTEFRGEYEGFYYVSGYVTDCKWPLVLKSSKGFTYAKDEAINRVPMVSYEVREALRSNELTLDEVEGWVWKPSEDAVNPFKPFVKEFYGLKEQHRDETGQYLQHKLILNSLYGKTYQALRLTDYEEEPELIWDSVNELYRKNKILYRAGGLYLPHVGAWITSLSRAKLHEDMHKYQAIDCATDSFKTLMTVPSGSGLGELKYVSGGLLLLIRPKLYVMFSDSFAEKVEGVGDLREYLKTLDIGSIRYPDDVVKYALHGFWGNVNQILELYRDKKNEYICEHMTKIRESLRQNKNPRVMETLTRGIKVNWNKEVGFCGITKKQALKTMERAREPKRSNFITPLTKRSKN